MEGVAVGQLKMNLSTNEQVNKGFWLFWVKEMDEQRQCFSFISHNMKGSLLFLVTWCFFSTTRWIFFQGLVASFM